MDALIVADSSSVRREPYNATALAFSSEKPAGKSLTWVPAQTGKRETLSLAESYLPPFLIRWIVGTRWDAVLKVGDEM